MFLIIFLNKTINIVYPHTLYKAVIFCVTLQKERDLELAARIGQSLLKQNQELTARNEMLDEQIEIAKEEVFKQTP